MHLVMTVNAAWNIWNFRRALVRGLLEDGHEISILAPPDDSVAQLEALGCRFFPLEMNVKGLNPIQDWRLIQRFKSHFRTLRPDAILSYTVKNNIFGAMAARRLDIPFLPNVTGLGTAFLSGGLLQTVAERLYRRGFRALPVIFFQNPDDRELFVRRRLIDEEQAQLLPGSGIDLAYFSPTPLPQPSDAPVFLMIARVLRDKGVLEYVEAAALVKKQHPHARFQLLGAVGWENRTAIPEDQVQQWQDNGLIEYLGTAPDIRPLIAAAHCVVLPSYREGAPRTLIEAAAMARPLIATNVPGCRSVVDHQSNGLLCTVRSGESLAEACQLFLDMPHADKVAMGQAGRDKMEREYDQRLILEAYQGALAKAAPLG